MKNKTKRCVEKQSIGECPSKSVRACVRQENKTNAFETSKHLARSEKY